MRLLLACLALLLILLQYRLWVGDGGIMELRGLRGDIQRQEARNGTLTERNRALEAEVRDLKNGLDAVEERARVELGMIRDGETFYRVIPPRADGAQGP